MLYRSPSKLRLPRLSSTKEKPENARLGECSSARLGENRNTAKGDSSCLCLGLQGKALSGCVPGLPRPLCEHWESTGLWRVQSLPLGPLRDSEVSCLGDCSQPHTFSSDGLRWELQGGTDRVQTSVCRQLTRRREILSGVKAGKEIPQGEGDIG